MGGSARLLVAIVVFCGIVAVDSAAVESATPLGRCLLPTRGMWADFEQPGSGSGWFTGDLLRQLVQRDVREPVVEAAAAAQVDPG
jgi:hypothetical protein